MDGHRQRILLVEDDLETRTLLRRMLTLCGWEVCEAGTIAEGLAQLDPPPGGLVLDMELPDGDGETILRRVRQEQLPTRIVVQTGLVDPDRLEEIADLRPDGLVRKPLDSEGLRTICEVSNAVERSSPRGSVGQGILIPGNRPIAPHPRQPEDLLTGLGSSLP